MDNSNGFEELSRATSSGSLESVPFPKMTLDGTALYSKESITTVLEVSDVRRTIALVLVSVGVEQRQSELQDAGGT